MKNNTLITIVLIVVFAAVGFFAGMKYQENNQANKTNQFGNMQRQGQRFNNGSGLGGNRQGFKPVNGEIISTDDKSVTVKMQDGSTKIVLFSDKTIINKESTGSASDLKTGGKIAVFGTENSDGSVTAQSIQLNPVFRNNSQNQ